MPKQELYIHSPELDFSVGDFVVHKDDSTTKCIFKFIGFIEGANSPRVRLKLVSVQNRKVDGDEIKHKISKAKEYIEATKEELLEARLILRSVDFILDEN